MEKLSYAKQLNNVMNSLYEDIFKASEEEIDEMLTELGYDPKKVGDDGLKLIQELQEKLKAKNLKQADVSGNEANQPDNKKDGKVAVCRCEAPELIIGDYENKVCNKCGEILKAN